VPHDDAGAGADGLEPHLDVAAFRGVHSRWPVAERQPWAGLPGVHPADLGVALHQQAVLEPQLAAGVAPQRAVSSPPGGDVPGEQVEGGGGVHFHLDCHMGLGHSSFLCSVCFFA
jgi:hypothetical protein